MQINKTSIESAFGLDDQISDPLVQRSSKMPSALHVSIISGNL